MQKSNVALGKFTEVTLKEKHSYSVGQGTQLCYSCLSKATAAYQKGQAQGSIVRAGEIRVSNRVPA